MVLPFYFRRYFVRPTSLKPPSYSAANGRLKLPLKLELMGAVSCFFSNGVIPMSFIEKLLELLPLTKEHWIAILLAVIIAGTIGGWLYINSFQNLIKSLEFANESLTFQLQEQRERNKSLLSNTRSFIPNRWNK